MTFSKHIQLSLLSTLAAGVLAFSTATAQAEDLSKDQVKDIVKELLAEEPELVFKALNDYQAEKQRKEQELAAENLKKYVDYFARDDAPRAGNKDGDITVVEFFDYNCGYCKRAFDDLAKLIDADDKVNVIFQEMPILGPSSRIMAEYALAAKRQGKYFEYHMALMDHKGGKDGKDLEKVAEKVGLDVNQLRKDAKSAEVKAEIEESVNIARDIGVRGTPAFIINGQLERGYLGPGGIETKIKQIRG